MFPFKVKTTDVAPEQVVVVHSRVTAQTGPLPRLLLLVPRQVHLVDDLLVGVVKHHKDVGDHQEAAERNPFLVKHSVLSYAGLLVALFTLIVVILAACPVFDSRGDSFTVRAKVRSEENVMLLKESDLTVRSPNLIIQVAHFVPTHLKIKIIIHTNPAYKTLNLLVFADSSTNNKKVFHNNNKNGKKE